MITDETAGQILAWLLGIADGEGVPTESDIAACGDPVVQEIMAGVVMTRDDVVYSAREEATAKAQLQAVVDIIAEGLLVCDAQGVVQWANPAAERFLGRAPGAAAGEQIALPGPGESTQIQRRRADATPAMADLSATPVEWDGRDAAYLVTLRDITDRRELERRALHDPLTGLPNRALLTDRLEHALGRITRSGEGLCVMFWDLDRFKQVNDHLGHQAGDQVLQETARRLTDATRPGDTVARIGGDEFVILCEGVDNRSEADEIIGRITLALSPPHPLGTETVEIAASAGIRMVTDCGEDADTLIADADMAMYAAKNEGRGTHRYFQSPMKTASEERYHLARALAAAFRHGQLEMRYQPIVDQGGVLAGFEALMRWHDPIRGMVPASQFIDAAEDSGLILELGTWALDAACAQARAWNRREPHWRALKMNVNFSALQISQPEFVELVSQTLRRHQIQPAQLGLEITETAVLKHETAFERIRQIADLGVDVLIDDFGTGYASLTYLRALPVSALKIDRSFTAHVATSPADLAIVRSQVSLAQKLGVSAVAEGVETLAQHELLAGIGCDQLQGYLYGRASSPQAVEQHFASAEQLRQSLVQHPMPAR